MPDFEYCRMTTADAPAVKTFLAQHFQSNEPPNRSGWLEWNLANPRGCWIQLCKDKKTIIGFSIFMPLQLQADTVISSGAFSISTMVDPAYQRQGIGSQFHRIRDANFDFALSSGQSPANYQLYLKLQFSHLSKWYDLLLVTRFPRPFLKKRYLRELWAWGLWVATNSFGTGNYRLEVTDQLPQQIGEFIAHRLDSHSIGPVVDIAYIQWRYQQHPYFQYQYFSVWQSSNCLGVAVMRQEKQTWILVDVFCSYEKLELFLRGLASCLRGQRVAGIFCGSTINHQFRAAKWHTFPHGTSLLGVTQQANLAPLLTARSWSFFAGESDRDR